jgi:hypothetical protein
MVDAFIDWRPLPNNFEDDGWDQIRCLYAYLAPKGREVIYIGKAWGKTVYERWCREAKGDFWGDLERERGVFSHRAAVGTIALDPGARLTHALLQDIESLLIAQLRPWGNIQNSRSRGIVRPGFAAECRGSWPLAKRLFRDQG